MLDYKKTTLIFAIIVNIIVSGFISYPHETEIIVENDSKDSVMCVLAIQHIRGGRIIESYHKDDDLLVENMERMLSFFIEGQASESPLFTLTTGSTASVSGLQWDTDDSYIACGTDTTTPSVADYDLTTQVDSNVVQAKSYTTNGYKMNVTLTTTIYFTDTYAIREFGLFAVDGAAKVMFARDVSASPFNVVDGDILTVSYILRFN
jgi:hypothetical protein